VADEEEFRAFVAGRSQALLSTAFLLTHDWGRAEDLLQSALVRAWLAWRRIAGSPEMYVRRVIGCTAGTVKSQTAKAMARLRTEVGESISTGRTGR
jgi:DNA-directed RNA polymerase specialized sigma24 family protein